MYTTGFNSFEHLVSEISIDEREALLRRIRGEIDPETQILEPPASPENQDEENELEVLFKEESFFIKLIVYLRALFSNMPVVEVYNTFKLEHSARGLAHDNPGLFDFKRRMLLADFYEKLTELKQVSDFFSPVVTGLENDAGGFYVFLGSLVAPQIPEQIAAEADPGVLPLEREASSELRASMLRKLDEILLNMPSDKRAALYTAIKGAEWIRQFTHLPFERFIASFSNTFEPTYTCTFQSVHAELSSFARLLCNGPRIATEVLEAFYLFAADNMLFEGTEAKPTAEEYMHKAAAQVAVIKMFITTVPLRPICRFTYSSATWIPAFPDGAEDWFIKYKARWRTWFDMRWSLWLENRKKESVRLEMQSVFNLNAFPLFTPRPWAELWGGQVLRNEYALGFTAHFIRVIYPQYIPSLKILLLEGDFFQKNNRVEFTDTCNELSRMLSLFDSLAVKFQATGKYGSVFVHYKDEKMRTIQNQSKINVLIDSIETEVSVIIGQFCDAVRSIQLLLGGILSEKRNSRYNSIANLMSIQGEDNLKFRKKLEEIQKGFETALDIIQKIEPIAPRT